VSYTIDFTSLSNQDLTAPADYTMSSGVMIRRMDAVTDTTIEIVNGVGLRVTTGSTPTGVASFLLDLQSVLTGSDCTRVRADMMILSSSDVTRYTFLGQSLYNVANYATDPSPGSAFTSNERIGFYAVKYVGSTVHAYMQYAGSQLADMAGAPPAGSGLYQSISVDADWPAMSAMVRTRKGSSAEAASYQYPVGTPSLARALVESPSSASEFYGSGQWAGMTLGKFRPILVFGSNEPAAASVLTIKSIRLTAL
jgi:hypothetical protein